MIADDVVLRAMVKAYDAATFEASLEEHCLLKAGAHELERVEAARRRAHLERLAKDVRDIAVWRLAGLGQAMSSSIEADYEARRAGVRALDAGPLAQPFAVQNRG